MDHPHLIPVRRVRQCLYYLRLLRKCKISSVLQKAFYTTAVESVVSRSIAIWYGSCTEHATHPGGDLHQVVHYLSQNKNLHHSGNKLFQVAAIWQTTPFLRY